MGVAFGALTLQSRSSIEIESVHNRNQSSPPGWFGPYHRVSGLPGAVHSSGPRHCRVAKEARDLVFNSFRLLNLRHVTALNDDVLRGGKRVAHMVREGHWDESVVVAPNEKARCVQTRKSGPESICAVRLFKIDVPNGRVERQASTSGTVHSQELIDTRLCPPAPGAGNHQSHRRSYGLVRHELEQPELGAKEPNKRNPSAFLPPSKRGRQEHEAVNSVWVAKSEFDGNSAPEAVAHDRRSLDAECVHELDYSPAEEWWIVARTERLVRISEARQINSDDLELVSERRDRREKRDLGCPEPMNHQYRFTGARPHYRHRSGRCRHPFKSNASGVVKTAGRRQNCNAQVKIVPNDEATSPVSGQPASCILCNRQPRGPIGDESRIANAAADGSTDLKFRAVNGNIPLSFVDYDCPNSRVLLGTIENRCVKASRKRTKDLFHGFSRPRLRSLGGTACLRLCLRHSCPTFGCPSALLGGKDSTRILRMTLANCRCIGPLVDSERANIKGQIAFSGCAVARPLPGSAPTPGEMLEHARIEACARRET